MRSEPCKELDYSKRSPQIHQNSKETLLQKHHIIVSDILILPVISALTQTGGEN